MSYRGKCLGRVAVTGEVAELAKLAGVTSRASAGRSTHTHLLVPPYLLSAAGARYREERQQWEHDRSDWEHWRGRLQEDLEAARALAGLDARKGLAAQLAEAEARCAAERATVERSWAARLESCEAAWAQRLEAEQRSSAARLEETKQRFAAEQAAREEEWAAAATEAEELWRKKLDELRAKWVIGEFAELPEELC